MQLIIAQLMLLAAFHLLAAAAAAATDDDDDDDLWRQAITSTMTGRPDVATQSNETSCHRRVM